MSPIDGLLSVLSNCRMIEVAMRNNNETTTKQHASNASFYEHLRITCNYILYEIELAWGGHTVDQPTAN